MAEDVLVGPDGARWAPFVRHEEHAGRLRSHQEQSNAHMKRMVDHQVSDGRGLGCDWLRWSRALLAPRAVLGCHTPARAMRPARMPPAYAQHARPVAHPPGPDRAGL